MVAIEKANEEVRGRQKATKEEIEEVVREYNEGKKTKKKDKVEE